MPPTVQDIRRQRVQVELDNVARVDARRAAVKSAYESAEQAYQAAKAVMEEFHAELMDVNEEHRLARLPASPSETRATELRALSRERELPRSGEASLVSAKAVCVP